MTEVLAVEWARYHINVNGIAPGAFASEMIERDAAHAWATSPSTSHASACSTRRWLDSTLLFLLSPASEAVTGTTIKVDDGQGSR